MLVHIYLLFIGVPIASPTLCRPPYFCSHLVQSLTSRCDEKVYLGNAEDRATFRAHELYRHDGTLKLQVKQDKEGEGGINIKLQTKKQTNAS